MQLRRMITVGRNIRIHHHSLLNAKHKTQLFSDGMVKTTLKQLGSDSTLFTWHPISI